MKTFQGEPYNTLYCDTCQKDVEKLAVKSYVDDDCLHGQCSECREKLLKN